MVSTIGQITASIRSSSTGDNEPKPAAVPLVGGRRSTNTPDDKSSPLGFIRRRCKNVFLVIPSTREETTKRAENILRTTRREPSPAGRLDEEKHRKYYSMSSPLSSDGAPR